VNAWPIGACLRKIQYPRRKAASEAAQRVYRQLGKRMKIYRCRFCHNFHLTSDKDD
jgi:hypothetical protein